MKPIDEYVRETIFENHDKSFDERTKIAIRGIMDGNEKTTDDEVKFFIGGRLKEYFTKMESARGLALIIGNKA